MIKKLKLFSVIFSTIVLLPFNSLAISCKGDKDGNNAVLNATNNDNEGETPEEIKDFIKSGLYDNKETSILEIKDLQENMDTIMANDLKTYLENLNSRLNASVSTTQLELDNQIIIQGLKNKILENCEKIDKDLKDTNVIFSEQFQEVAGKVLELNEDSVIFSLKKFNLREILDDIGKEDEFETMDSEAEEDEEEKVNIFADSKKLKIYNLTTDLSFTLTYSDGKKSLISVKDYNLFVVLEREKATLLTSGITKYIEEKISGKYEGNVIPIYLNGEPDKKINGYFKEIIEKSNYDLTDQNNKIEIGYYLAETFLPEIIFKNNDKDNEIKVWTKKTEIDEENKNIRDLQMDSNVQQQINFLKLFGNSDGQKQITSQILNTNVKVEKFLKDSSSHSYQKDSYYLLGTGSVTVNRWTIKGFALNPVPLKFKIFIKSQILEQQIADLITCLENLIETMLESRVLKRNDVRDLHSPIREESSYKDQYTVNIEIPKKYWTALSIKNVLPKKGEWKELEDILNELFIEKAKKISNHHFSKDSAAYKFTTKTSTDKDTLHFKMGNEVKKDYYSDSGVINTAVLDRPINIYFVFNSFRINLTNDLLLKRRRIEPKRNKKGIEETQDGNKIWFV